MKPRVAVSGVFLLVACGATRLPPAASQPDDAGSEPALAAAREIHQLQAQWREAIAAKDTGFFARTLTDDFLLTGGLETTTKAEYIRLVRDNTDPVPEARPTESQVRIHGDVGVATGLIDYPIPGNAEPLQMRYTEVWLRRAGRWMALHGHYSRSLSSGASPGPGVPQQ